MPLEKIYEDTIDFIGKLAWPATVLILFSKLKVPVRLMLAAIVTKIEKSGLVKIGKDGIEFQEELKTLSDKIEVIANRSDEIPELRPKAIATNENEESMDEFLKLAESFNESQNIDDEATRVKTKEYLARKMGILIVSKYLPKNAIAEIKSEGAFVGLMYSITLFPAIDDKEFVFTLYKQANFPFSKHSLLKAADTLIAKGFIEPSNFGKIDSILDFYSEGADLNLNKRIVRVRLLMDQMRM